MPYNTDAAGELDRVDRILLGACAAIWLAALGAGVAAVVALVDLGGGRPESSGDSDTPWLLYTVIGVSAAVIVGAVPLLLRARRTALADSPPTPARPAVAQAQPNPPVRGTEAATQKLRVPGTAAEPVTSRPGYPVARAVSAPAADPSVAAVDQLWLRCAVVIVCAIGIAVVAVGLATYLMAVDSNTAAWVFYVQAGVITLGMPAIPWFYLSQLRALLDKPAA